MINDKELKLLISILKEIDKHGLETFKSLNEKINTFSEIDLDAIFSLYRKMQRRPSKLRVDYQHETLKILDYVDAGRRVEIEKLILKIMSKVNFKSINELSEHLRSRGIYGMKISSWQEGAFRVVKYIETNNLSEKAINKIQEDMELNQSNDRSLERWSEIILSKDNQKK